MNQSITPSTTPASAPEWFYQAIENQAQSAYFRHQSINLHYLQWLDGSESVQDSKAKPALIFTHGFRGHARWWGFVAPFFSKHYRVYALDFSGMGDSDNSPVYDKDNHAIELLALIEHLQLSDVTVVGHSFGGGRSFRAAAKNSAPFKRIIVVDSHITFEDDVIGIDPSPQRQKKYYQSLGEGLNRFRLTPAQPDSCDYIVDYIGRHSLVAEANQWTWKFDPALLVEDITSKNGGEILSKVDCPVDYIYATDSVVVNQARAERIYASLARPGRFIRVPGGHHHLMASHPVTLIATLQALL